MNPFTDIAPDVAGAPAQDARRLAPPAADPDDAVVVQVGGTKMLFAAARAYIRCRPGRPLDGCQGTGIITRSMAAGGIVERMREVCGCIEIGYRRMRRSKR